MKRAFLSLAVAALWGAAAWAVPVSLGSGLAIGTSLVDLDWENTRFKSLENGIGASFFFDAHYVSLSADILNGYYDISGRAISPAESPADDEELSTIKPEVASYSASLLNINIIGKFPVALYDLSSVYVFPMIGVGYRMSRVVEDAGPFRGTFNEIKVLFGLGGDFYLNRRVFFRISLIPYYHLTRESTQKIVRRVSGNDAFLAHGGFGVNGYLMMGIRLGTLSENTPLRGGVYIQS
ncbi:MAG: hypothetical protein FWD94_01590 [Treponema sp.]|nr:hypothetical protein [Treponema sp.]